MFHPDGKLPLLLSRAQDYNKRHGNTEWLMGLENPSLGLEVGQGYHGFKNNVKRGKRVKIVF